MFGCGIRLHRRPSLSLPGLPSPPPPVPTPASCPVLGPTACTDGCRRRRSQALLAGLGAFGGRVGEKRAPSCKAGAAVTRGVGAARRQPCMPHRGPLTPCPYSLPSLSLRHLARSSFHAWRACQGCAWTRAGWVDPSTPPRRQHCAKSC